MRYASLPTLQLQAWSQLNDVQFHDCGITASIITDDGINKGGGLLANGRHEPTDLLLSIPQDLILSKEAVMQSAKTDFHLRELVEALEDYIQTPRKAIVLFLLYQMTISSPDLSEHALGVKSPFTHYVCSLPKQIPLPTFFSSSERELLIGTSLFEALDQKLSSLERDFELFREKTATVEWCRKAWWDEETGHLTFHDWKVADSMYRSRALELPRGTGDAMVPVLDMANHAAEQYYNARFEVDAAGRVLLLTREQSQITEKDEITINYGPGGAAESIFSYGFLEDGVQSAREMFLTLQAPNDDPLRIAKMHLAKEAPGVRIFLNADGQPSWESNFVWWACVNEEDGLDFEVLQTIDGARDLQAVWNGEPLEPDKLKVTLMNDPRKELFVLRATVMIQQRVEKQGEELSISQTAFDESRAHVSDERKFVHDTIRRLRELELDLLTASFGALEFEKQQLLSSRTVTEYLALSSNLHESEGQLEEDFS